MRFCVAIALVVLALPSVCRADFFIAFADSSETVAVNVNGLVLSCPAEPLPCSSTTFFSSSKTDFSMSFNIFDQDGVTLSDTLQITGVSIASGLLKVTTTFVSDAEGSVLAELPGGTTMIENGTIQTAAIINLGAENYRAEFQSDIDPVPEPRFIGLLSLGLVGIALLARRFAGDR